MLSKTKKSLLFVNSRTCNLLKNISTNKIRSKIDVQSDSFLVNMYNSLLNAVLRLLITGKQEMHDEISGRFKIKNI